MKKIIVISVLFYMTSNFFPATTFAQEEEGLFRRDRNISIKHRPRPDYESQGARIGSFFYTPSLSLSTKYDDNIFASENQEEEDFIGTFNPAIAIRSDWSNHALNIGAKLVHQEYADFETESVMPYNFFADARFDISHADKLSFRADYSREFEPRTAAGDASRSLSRIRYNVFNWAARSHHESGRLQFIADATFSSLNYNDVELVNGTIADQDFRDRDNLGFKARAAFALSPATALYVDVEYENDNFDIEDAGINRDQDGYRINGGLDFELGHLIRGYLGVGYLQRSFDDGVSPEIDGFSFSAQLEWFLSPLWTISGSAERKLHVAELRASRAFETDTFGVEIDYELRRNIILNTGINFANENYQGIDRDDTRRNIHGSIKYLLNRYASLSFDIHNSNLDSTGVDAQLNFNITQLTFGLHLSY